MQNGWLIVLENLCQARFPAGIGSQKGGLWRRLPSTRLATAKKKPARARCRSGLI